MFHLNGRGHSPRGFPMVSRLDVSRYGHPKPPVPTPHDTQVLGSLHGGRDAPRRRRSRVAEADSGRPASWLQPSPGLCTRARLGVLSWLDGPLLLLPGAVRVPRTCVTDRGIPRFLDCCSVAGRKARER